MYFNMNKVGYYRYTGTSIGRRYGSGLRDGRRDVIDCTGNELDIGSCSHRISSCSQYEAVSIECESGKHERVCFPYMCYPKNTKIAIRFLQPFRDDQVVVPAQVRLKSVDRRMNSFIYTMYTNVDNETEVTSQAVDDRSDDLTPRVAVHPVHARVSLQRPAFIYMSGEVKSTTFVRPESDT